MRYFCAECKRYWTNRDEEYTIATPVRDCPDCLAKKGYRWKDASQAWKEKIE